MYSKHPNAIICYQEAQGLLKHDLNSLFSNSPPIQIIPVDPEHEFAFVIASRFSNSTVYKGFGFSPCSRVCHIQYDKLLILNVHLPHFEDGESQEAFLKALKEADRIINSHFGHPDREVRATQLVIAGDFNEYLPEEMSTVVGQRLWAEGEA